MTFRQPLWMIGVGHLLGVFGLITGISLVALGYVSGYWLLAWPLFHVIGSLTVTVALHRYFCHRSFKTSAFWHKAMAYTSTLLLIGSPLGWSTSHTTHHIHSDKAGDPHRTDWTYLFWKRYNHVKMSKRLLRRLVSDPTLAFVHRNAMAIWFSFVLLLALLSWKVLLFGYLMALGSVHTIGSFHQVFSHTGKRPRNLAFMEFLLPAFGEWHHATHHEHPGRKDMRTAWWHLDLGALFIRLIERRSP
jgi:fatty-acid desaturase